MLFLIIRILPILLPVAYFFMLRGFFVFTDRWYYWLAAAVILNILYFIFFSYKLKRMRIWFFAIYSIIFVSLGFAYVSLMSSVFLINLFLVVWSIIYLIYLEAVFNYLYRTERFFLLELKSITAYINLFLFFILSFSLLNFYILFSLKWWWLFLAFIPVTFVILYNRFLSFEFPHKDNAVYSGAITLILTEMVIALLWWPNGIYVLAFMLLIAYYFLSSIGTSYFKEQLTKKIIVQYSLLALVMIALVLATAQWL